MKTSLLSTTALITVVASSAVAQSGIDQIVSILRDQDYDSIEVTTGPSQVKVEAVRDGMVLEAVYDSETWEILEQEVSEVDDDDDYEPGVVFESDDDDFFDEDDDDDDDEDDDDDDDDDDVDDDD